MLQVDQGEKPKSLLTSEIEVTTKPKIKGKPKTVIATATKSPASEEIYGKFQGADAYDLGGGCAILTFSRNAIEKLLPAAVEYVSKEGVLEYDKQFKMIHMCTRHRGEGFFSDLVTGYQFSNGSVTAQPLHHTLSALLDEVNLLVPDDPFSAVFVNHYRDEYDSIGKHSDKDVADGEEIGVMAISYGVSRIITFRPIDTTNQTLKQAHISTEHGQTLVMYGRNFQKLFSHAIVGKDNKKKPSPSTAKDMDTKKTTRFSFTFRRHHAAQKKSDGKRKRGGVGVANPTTP